MNRIEKIKPGYLFTVAIAVGILGYIGTNDEGRAIGPTVTNTIPANAATAVSTDASVTAQFSGSMMGSTITSNTYHLYSEMSGFRYGDIIFNAATNQATLNPNSDFKPGERIFAELTAGITNAAGNTALDHTTWTFRAAVASGSVGSFTTNWISGDANNSYSVSLGDLNGDGALDAFVVNSDQNNKVYLGDSSGGFTTNWISGDADRSYGVSLGDLNGDGALDAFVANYSTNNKVYLGDGSGGFTTNWISGDANASYSVSLGDLNGDGALDAFVVNAGVNNKVYLGDGAGGFTTNWISGDSDASYGVSLGDLNGDGVLDAFVVNFGQNNKVYLGDGAGGFTTNWISGDTDNGRGVSLGDLNGDGVLDAFVVNKNQNNKVYLGDGAGGFTTNWISGDTDNGRGVSLGDLNGDGALDAFVANSSVNNKVYLGDGAGSFTTNWTSGDSDDSRCVSLGDLNGDGALDTFVVNFGQNNRVYLNQISADIYVLGTNGAVIANNEAASTAKGTDFGQIGCNSAVTNNFSITNAAATALTISSWTTNGTGADKFSVIGMPSTVGANSLTNFSVSFNPCGSAGTYTATVSIANSGTNTPFLVNLQGEALSQGAIGITPASLTYTATYNGTNPAVQTFTLTNNGQTAYTYTYTATYGAGASGWFTPAPTNGSISAAGSYISTAFVNIAGLNAGTYYATNVVTSPTATNSPQTLPITLTVGKAGQAITFTNPGEQNVTNTVGLAATASSGLVVSFAVGSGPGSITGGTNLSFTATGQVSIAASQAGDACWNAAPNETNTFSVTNGVQPTPQTGTLSINVTPDTGSWTMSGPTNYSGVTSGTGDLAGTNVPIGTYMVEYGALTGYRTPSAQTNEVTSGASVVFSGVYEKKETPGDFTGDGKTDLAVYDEATGCWYIRSEDGTVILWQTAWGGQGFTSVQGDYDGDGRADMAVYYAGYWYIRTVAGVLILWEEPWGGPDFTPVTGDYNGDGISDLTVYHEGTGFWYSRTVPGALLMWDASLGGPGYTPVPGDYDGDGQSELGVYCNGYWFVKTVDEKELLSGTMPWGGTFGGPDFTPVAADYDGDGITDLAVYYEQSGAWFVTTLSGTVLVWGEQWGGPGFTPVPGDYNGDGISDLAVYYNGYWFVEAVDGTLIMYAENWGARGYEPIGR